MAPLFFSKKALLKYIESAKEPLITGPKYRSMKWKDGLKFLGWISLYSQHSFLIISLLFRKDLKQCVSHNNSFSLEQSISSVREISDETWTFTSCIVLCEVSSATHQQRQQSILTTIILIIYFYILPRFNFIWFHASHRSFSCNL